MSVCILSWWKRKLALKKGSVLTFQQSCLKGVCSGNKVSGRWSFECSHIITLIHAQDLQRGAQSSSHISLPKPYPLSFSKYTLLGTDQARHHDVYKLPQDGIMSVDLRACSAFFASWKSFPRWFAHGEFTPKSERLRLVGVFNKANIPWRSDLLQNRPLHALRWACTDFCNLSLMRFSFCISVNCSPTLLFFSVVLLFYHWSYTCVIVNKQ
jgi:hypothetical protein